MFKNDHCGTLKNLHTIRKEQGMKFPVLWLAFVSLWVWGGTEKGVVSRSRITLYFGAKAVIFLGVCSIIIRPFMIIVKSSIFRFEPHGHVITGDLRIVRNRQLRRLLEKGPKYREQNIIDCRLNKKILITAIDDYAKNWSKRKGYHVSTLEEWSETVKLIISNRITNSLYN